MSNNKQEIVEAVIALEESLQDVRKHDQKIHDYVQFVRFMEENEEENLRYLLPSELNFLFSESLKKDPPYAMLLDYVKSRIETNKIQRRHYIGPQTQM